MHFVEWSWKKQNMTPVGNPKQICQEGVKNTVRDRPDLVVLLSPLFPVAIGNESQDSLLEPNTTTSL